MDTLVVISRGTPRELLRALSKGRQKVALCAPEKAPELLLQLPAAAVILDGGRHQGRDLQLIGDLKRQSPGVPIVYLAEQGTERIAVEAFRRGARDYYRKPVSLFDLRRNVLRLAALQKSAAGRRRPYLWAPLQTGESLEALNPGIPVNLLRAIAHMEDHYGGEVSLADLAEQAGMSKFHFCRVFRETVGESPIRYLVRLRMDRAGVLLRTTDLPVSEIAGVVGFGDVSNFSRTFRRIFSLSPSRYRRRYPPAR